jgi:mycothiol S-conjugate amidase
MCHTVSMAAFAAAGDPAAYPHAGEPWQPLKIYYNQTFSRERIVAFHEALIALEEESPYAEWLENWAERPARTVTTRVPCADYFEQRDQALLAHATQIDPDGTFFRVPREVQKQVWPTEEYEVAISYVPIEPVEDELFAGLPDVAAADAMATKGDLQIAYDGRKDPS